MAASKWTAQEDNKMPRRSPVRLIIKLSKLCNLRCTYCYEYGDLANKQRMPVEAVADIFSNMARHVAENPCDFISFVWHGGEPFMIPLEFYGKLRALQENAFAPGLVRHNSVQTNLTILTDRHLEFLRSEEFFTDVGVSFDVHGDQRVDTRGRQKTETVLGNLQKLIDERVNFGAIAVLARNTLPYARSIYAFYDRLGIECRFIPFYKHSFAEQVSEHAITYDELVGALKEIFDEWITSEWATAVEPIDEYVDYAVAYIGGRPPRYYDKEKDEYAFVVDIDGSVWGHGEAHERDLRYGNLVKEPFDAVLASSGRRLALDCARRRMATYCEKCPYYGACPGAFVADASVQQQQMLACAGCPVREMLDYIVETLERTKLTDALSAHTAEGRRENEALSVAL
jgi:uncharacterized protein